jgi:hypothetical protein
MNIKLLKLSNFITETKQDFWIYLLNLTNSINNVDKLNIIMYNYCTDHKIKMIIFDKTIFETFELFNRDIIKFTLMRIVYGSNAFTIAQNYKIEKNVEKITYKHIHIILAIFNIEFKFELLIFKYIVKLNDEIYNIKNSGLTINSKYINFTNNYNTEKSKDFSFQDIMNKEHNINYKISTNKIDKRKSNSSIRPNLFHNIDSNIMLSLCEVFMINNLFILPIHDAFIIKSKDEQILRYNYNLSVYNNRYRLIDLINENLKLIQNKNLITESNNILKILNIRKIDVEKIKESILQSKFTLKRETPIINN